MDDVDRPERLKGLYKRLQALFPEFDAKKEQAMQMNAIRARAQAQVQAQAQAQAQQGQTQSQPQHPLPSGNATMGELAATGPGR